MKRISTLFGLLHILALMSLVSSCSKEFNEYYNPTTTLDKNIIEVLEEDSRFSVFVEIIDRLDLRKALGEAAIYTCLAPLDEHIQAYFEGEGFSSIDQVPDERLRQYVNYHFISGMYYEYDFGRRYQLATTGINKSRASLYRTRTEGTNVGKSIRVFTPGFFIEQPSDYQSLYGFTADVGSFMIEGAQVSATDRDIHARNGVIHVLETPLRPLPRTDEALAQDPETTLFSSWLEWHAQYVIGERDEFGWVDTTLYKTFNFGRDLADENVLSTLVVPTNEAIRNYFEPYMDLLENEIDSVPRRVMYSLIRSSVIASTFYESDLIRRSPEWNTFNSFPQQIQDVTGSITGSVLASNSVIYKSNRVIESSEMNSVVSGIYMKHKMYSQWYWMFQNTALASGLFDWLLFQHRSVTLLVHPDEIWGTPLAQDMNTDARQYRYDQCRAGILGVDVREEGGFRKRYYPTDVGHVLYDEGRFYDHTGHSVALLDPEPAWEKTNGAIFEIDGFLTPLDRQDNTITVYNYIQNDPEQSLFASAIERAELIGELQLTGFFTYTVFAPSNDAIAAAGINVSDMTLEQARDFVNRHVVANRHVFTDGVFTGQLTNKNGQWLTMSGAWESFTITRQSGNTATPILNASNIEGSNGVVHRINQVL